MEEVVSSLQWLWDILNMPLVVYGTTSLSVMGVVAMLIKWLVPKDKIILNQEKTITKLEARNKILEEENATNKAKIERLEAQVNIIIDNSYNKNIKKAKTIDLTKINVEETNANITAIFKEVKKKVKVKKGNKTNG